MIPDLLQLSCVVRVLLEQLYCQCRSLRPSNVRGPLLSPSHLAKRRADTHCRHPKKARPEGNEVCKQKTVLENMLGNSISFRHLET